MKLRDNLNKLKKISPLLDFISSLPDGESKWTHAHLEETTSHDKVVQGVDQVDVAAYRQACFGPGELQQESFFRSDTSPFCSEAHIWEYKRIERGKGREDCWSQLSSQYQQQSWMFGNLVGEAWRVRVVWATTAETTFASTTPTRSLYINCIHRHRINHFHPWNLFNSFPRQKDKHKWIWNNRFWQTIVAWLEAGISGDFPLDSLYNKYYERILVFHKIIMQLMKIHVKYVADYGWPDAIILAMFVLCVWFK